MNYSEKREELSKQMDEATAEYEKLGIQLDERKRKGFFYRLTHRRELRDLRSSIEGIVYNMDTISSEQLDLDRLIERQHEEEIDATNEMLVDVTNQIEQYAKENGLYLARDFKVINYSESFELENKSEFSNYEWVLVHGDGHMGSESFNGKSVQDLIDAVHDYGDMIPVSLENQSRIISEIESTFYFHDSEKISLQNSDQGLQVVISEVDESGAGNPLLDKKISYEELTENILAAEENEFTIDGKRMLLVKSELDKGVEENVQVVKEDLEKEGLYLSHDIFASQSGPTYDDYALTIAFQTVAKRGDRVNGIPTKEQIRSFAEENEIVTRFNPVEQKLLEKELNKITFNTDEAPYSYNTLVGDLGEDQDGPYFRIFDDTDAVFEVLVYDTETDKWVGSEYDFEVENPISSIKEKYNEPNTTKKFAEVLENMNKTELELMNLIDNVENESIDNQFADWGQSTYEARNALDKFIYRLNNNDFVKKIKSIYEENVYCSLGAAPRGKVELNDAGRMIQRSLDEKNAQFFGINKNQKVVEGDPELLGFRWGLEYTKDEYKGQPTFQDFVQQVRTFQSGKHPEGQDFKVAFHVWTFTDVTNTNGQPVKMSEEAITDILNNVLRDEQSVEVTENLPEGWNWRSFSDGSGSLVNPDGDFYFSFREAGNGYKMVNNPETGEPQLTDNITDFKREAEEWVKETLLTNSRQVDEERSTQHSNDLQPELEI